MEGPIKIKKTLLYIYHSYKSNALNIMEAAVFCRFLGCVGFKNQSLGI